MYRTQIDFEFSVEGSISFGVLKKPLKMSICSLPAIMSNPLKIFRTHNMRTFAVNINERKKSC